MYALAAIFDLIENVAFVGSLKLFKAAITDRVAALALDEPAAKTAPAKSAETKLRRDSDQ